MNRNLIHIKVFLASPTDTFEERNFIENQINRWNELIGKQDHIHLEVKRWEKDAPVTSEKEPQDIIDEVLLHDSDILIALFWTKFSSSGNPEISHTRDEIQYFLEKKKPVIFYMLTKKISPTEINPDDLKKINGYRKFLRAEGHTYREIPSKDDIENHLFKDLKYNIGRANINELAIQKSESSTSVPDKQSGKQWFENSIKGSINKYLHESGFLNLEYRRELTFSENCLLWQAKGDNFTQVHLESSKRAREDAFNEKYGHYDYSKDLRSKHAGVWYRPITQAIEQHFSEFEKIQVIGVASNDGTELSEIFDGFKKPVKISVLDFSAAAIAKGRKKHPEFEFIHGNMEGCTLRRGSYDLYLNLRSIHSSGVDIRQTLPECLRILKPGGTCVISVSDGYLIGDEKSGELIEQRGMFDNRNKVFLIDKTRVIAEKIFSKLVDFGFVDVELHSGKAEMFIIGKNPKVAE